MGLRVSLFGTYRDRYHSEYNFDLSRYVAGNSSDESDDGTVNRRSFQWSRAVWSDTRYPRQLYEGTPV